MAPSTQKAWSVTKAKGGPKESLPLNSSAAVPSIGEHDVLVKSTSPKSLVLFLTNTNQSPAPRSITAT